MSTLNISAYTFVGIDDAPDLRQRLLERCTVLGLLGTILIAPEGINLVLAGPRPAIDAFMASLRADVRFADITPKESHSQAPPFRRMRVRLKKEIITMRHPLVQPGLGRAPSVTPATLARWLAAGHDDAGREVVMLDTRNDFEVDQGSFASVVDYRLASFGDFPAAVAADRERYTGKTVVSFCTGGIRCEKAAIHMRDIGIEHVYQLEGGILKYFEDVGEAHFRGECFVFDARIALDPGLRPATKA